MSDDYSFNSPPELQGWDEMIQSKSVTKEILWPIKATYKLVMSLVNLRFSVSSQVGYLNNKVERLEKSIDRLDTSIKHSVETLTKDLKTADASSSNLATALNRLTFYGVLAAGVGVFVSLLQFLYENHIWPFSL